MEDYQLTGARIYPEHEARIYGNGVQSAVMAADIGRKVPQEERANDLPEPGQTKS